MSWRSKPVPVGIRSSTSVSDMRRGIGRIKERLQELSAFNANAISTAEPPELAALSTSIQRTLEKIFGSGTPDLERFSGASKLQWSASVYYDGYPQLYHYIEGISRNIEHSKVMLNQAIKILEEDISDIENNDSQIELIVDALPLSRNVFIVHGHDEGARETVARFLEKIDLKPIILHEQPNMGRTIIAKFRDEAATTAFAVVLMTPDDHGAKDGAPTKKRARQNVVFELGFFIGALGAEKVTALVKGDVEKPSDFEGVVYISLDQPNWKLDLAREIKSSGLGIDFNKVLS